MRPFYCGTQAEDWIGANCDTCSKGAPNWGADPAPCPIQQALNEAWWGDGEVSVEIADRMGATANPLSYCWPCAEHDPPFDQPDDKEVE